MKILNFFKKKQEPMIIKIHNIKDWDGEVYTIKDANEKKYSFKDISKTMGICSQRREFTEEIREYKNEVFLELAKMKED